MTYRRRVDDTKISAPSFSVNDLHDVLSDIVDQQKKPQAPVYSLKEIGSGFIALAIFLIAGIGGWVALNTQISTLKVTLDLQIAQIQKDILVLDTSHTEMHKAWNIQMDARIAEIKHLADQVGELDSTVNQLYNTGVKRSGK